MVVVNRRSRHRSGPPSIADDSGAGPPEIVMDDDEARAFFDREARRLVGLSGTEFIRRYDRGDYAAIEEDEFGRAVVELSFIIPFGR